MAAVPLRSGLFGVLEADEHADEEALAADCSMLRLAVWFGAFRVSVLDCTLPPVRRSNNDPCVLTSKLALNSTHPFFNFIPSFTLELCLLSLEPLKA